MAFSSFQREWGRVILPSTPSYGMVERARLDSDMPALGSGITSPRRREDRSHLEVLSRQRHSGTEAETGERHNRQPLLQCHFGDSGSWDAESHQPNSIGRDQAAHDTESERAESLPVAIAQPPSQRCARRQSAAPAAPAISIPSITRNDRGPSIMGDTETSRPDSTVRQHVRLGYNVTPPGRVTNPDRLLRQYEPRRRGRRLLLGTPRAVDVSDRAAPPCLGESVPAASEWLPRPQGDPGHARSACEPVPGCAHRARRHGTADPRARGCGCDRSRYARDR